MAKRTAPNSEEPGSPCSKRTKKEHERDESEDFEDVPSGLSTTTKGDPASGGQKSASATSTKTTSSLQQQSGSEQIQDTQTDKPKSPTPQPPQKSLRARPSFIPILGPAPISWLRVTDPRDNKYVDPYPRRKPLKPKPEATSEFKLPIPTKRQERKSLTPKPAFAILEDATATIDDIEELEDEYFWAAARDAHYWVEMHCQQASFDLSIKIVDWALELVKRAEKKENGEEPRKTLEELEGRLSWLKQDMEWAYRAAMLTGCYRKGRPWFKPEFVERLADLFEETLSRLDLEIVDIKLESRAAIENLEYMTYKVCGYCQGKGLYGSKWPMEVVIKGGDEDHYERSGRAWKRIVDWLAGDLWETSEYIVENWYWHNKMMNRVLGLKEKIEHVDLLRARWANRSNHPLAPTRSPLENIPDTSVNGLHRDEEDQGNLEDGVWIE
jgi:hypothetical protein